MKSRKGGEKQTSLSQNGKALSLLWLQAALSLPNPVLFQKINPKFLSPKRGQRHYLCTAWNVKQGRKVEMKRNLWQLGCSCNSVMVFLHIWAAPRIFPVFIKRLYYSLLMNTGVWAEWMCWSLVTRTVLEEPDFWQSGHLQNLGMWENWISFYRELGPGLLSLIGNIPVP